MKVSKKELIKYKNYKVAADYWGVSERTIRRWMQECGIYQPRAGYGPGKLNSDKAKQIRQLYRSNKYTQAQIAEMFGVTQAMIGRVVNNVAHKTNIVLKGKAKTNYYGNQE